MAITVTYLVVLFAGQILMRSLPVMRMSFLFRVHNLFLSVSSLVLLVLFMDEVLPKLWTHGLFYSVCEQDMYTPRLELLLYVNHLAKVYELFDTIFLVLRKKKLEFLHVYHHSLTMILTYSQLLGRTTVSWLVVSINLLVHVIMYYYYFRAAGGARLWWKRYLTSLQITQFVIDLVFIYFCSYQHFAYHYTTWPVYGKCSGTEGAAIFGCTLITSYLFLFIEFFRKTYNSKKGVTSKKSSSSSVSKSKTRKAD